MPFLPSSNIRAKARQQKRQGLSVTSHYLISQNNVHTFETGKNVHTEKGNKMKDINLRSLAATTSMGGGLTKLRRQSKDLNLPQKLNEKPYNNFLSYFKTSAVKNSERSIRAAAHELQKLEIGG